MSYYGSQYGCNPKYLSEYVVRMHPDWDVVWAFTDVDDHDILGIRKVRYMSFKYFFELCTARVVVSNYRMLEYFKKRKNQYYIQTWHSSLRLKMIEKDVEKSLKPNYVKMAKADSKNIDLLLSGCEKSTEIFKNCFWYEGEITPSGTPRSDIFFAKDKENILREIKSKLNLSEGNRVVLYAPTFRKDEGLECYNVDFNVLQNELTKKYGGSWKVLVRLHPHLLNKSKQLLDGYGAIDVTSYDDIQELLMLADVLITDYSSVMFDFAPSLRPCFLYATDLEQYQKSDRNLYFKIEELPFDVCLSNEKLCESIQNFDVDVYVNRVNDFLARIGSYEDGLASERVTKRIEEWMS